MTLQRPLAKSTTRTRSFAIAASCCRSRGSRPSTIWIEEISCAKLGMSELGWHEGRTKRQSVQKGMPGRALFGTSIA